MKKKIKEKQMGMQVLTPEEMSKICGGRDKPKTPKSPDEPIIFT